MMDPRAIERTMCDLTRLIEEQGFETEEEVEEFARGFRSGAALSVRTLLDLV